MLEEALLQRSKDLNAITKKMKKGTINLLKINADEKKAIIYIN